MQEKLKCYYLTPRLGDQSGHPFPTVIYLNVNVVAQLEFEFAYYNSALGK